MPHHPIQSWAGAASAAILLLSGPASAAGRTHDGFQFRGAAGGGYLAVSETSEGDPNDHAAYGSAGTFEAYFGGTPAEGLVLGGTLGFASALGPNRSVNGQEIERARLDVSLNFLTVGPYIDYYPDPRKGFHVLGTAGFAYLNVTNASDVSDTATGVALGAGIGYDWWVSNDWSLGILARFQYARMSLEYDGIEFTENAFLPALMFSFQYQ